MWRESNWANFRGYAPVPFVAVMGCRDFALAVADGTKGAIMEQPNPEKRERPVGFLRPMCPT
jgi:hypothetical protein